jgi:uncharacterized protein YkwD
MPKGETPRRRATAVTIAALACALWSGSPRAGDTLTLASLVYAPVDTSLSSPLPAGDDSASILRLVNDYRDRHGLPPLHAEPVLQDIAERHSRDMALRGRLTHDGFRRRFDRAPGRICVENVGTGHVRVEQLLEGWRGAEAHRRNLLEPRIRRVGLGNSGRYVTFFACG